MKRHATHWREIYKIFDKECISRKKKENSNFSNLKINVLVKNGYFLKDILPKRFMNMKEVCEIMPNIMNH